MFRDPIRSSPLVADVSDVDLRTRIQRADTALFREPGLRLPHLRVT